MKKNEDIEQRKCENPDCDKMIHGRAPAKQRFCSRSCSVKVSRHLRNSRTIQAAEAHSGSLDDLIKNPKIARLKLGMNQSDFWALYGAKQVAGSGYEAGRVIPEPTLMLMVAHHEGMVTTEQLRLAAEVSTKFQECR